MYLPTTVALAVVATLGYLLGRRTRYNVANPNGIEADLRRVRAVMAHLDEIAERVRVDLAIHQSRIAKLKEGLCPLGEQGGRAGAHDVICEVESVLEPTLQLIGKISLANDELRQQSGFLMSLTETRTDSLTRTANRKALDEQLASCLAMFTRYELPFSLALFDIDHFKHVNDTRGHTHGDQVLKAVARLLSGESRETDTVARYGGEEFVVLMPHTDLTGAVVFAEKIRVSVEKSKLVTVSGGVASVQRDDDAKSLIARADKALYAAKDAGRNRIARAPASDATGKGQLEDDAKSDLGKPARAPIMRL
jgi:diguanylate cyclase (GGDEF)-like protein